MWQTVEPATVQSSGLLGGLAGHHPVLFVLSGNSTLRNKTFNNLKVLERGPLRLVKVTFTRHL